MQKLLPDNVMSLFEVFEKAGYELYLVGGAVRNLVLGIEPHDYDFATNALPEQTKALFEHTADTGIKYGTVTVFHSNGKFEVTTYRTEAGYNDYRHPDEVKLVSSLYEDLSHRDFTMNAMAFNPSKGLIDPFYGENDIWNKVVRCVRNADERYNEDPLRMMRAVRFACQLNFVINGTQSIASNAHLLAVISKERIRDELNKILLTKTPSLGLWNLRYFGLMEYIIPDICSLVAIRQNNPYHIYNVFDHTAVSLDHSPPILLVRLALLLHDIGKRATMTTDENGIDHFYGHAEVSADMARKIMLELRYDSKTVHDVCTLIAHHTRDVTASMKSVRQLLSAIGSELFIPWLYIRYADIAAQSPTNFDERKEELDKIHDIYNSIMADKQSFSIKDLAINGHDVMAIGYTGRDVGAKLQIALNYIIEDPENNSKEKLLALLQKRGTE